MKEIKEFKTTCVACGKVTFRPYVDFAAAKAQYAASPIKNTAKEAAVIGGTALACPTIGCCLAFDKARHAASPEKTVEQNIKDYCQAHMCKACGSFVMKTEVITHNVE